MSDSVKTLSYKEYMSMCDTYEKRVKVLNLHISFHLIYEELGQNLRAYDMCPKFAEEMDTTSDLMYSLHGNDIDPFLSGLEVQFAHEIGIAYNDDVSEVFV